MGAMPVAAEPSDEVAEAVSGALAGACATLQAASRLKNNVKLVTTKHIGLYSEQIFWVTEMFS